MKNDCWKDGLSEGLSEFLQGVRIIPGASASFLAKPAATETVSDLAKWLVIMQKPQSYLMLRFQHSLRL